MNKILLITLLAISTSSFAQNVWDQLGSAPIGRHHPVSFAIDGKGYAITGSLFSGNPTNTAFEYDPTTDTWTQIASFPGTARSFAIGGVSNGIAYLGFGASSTSYLNDFWSFDPSTNTWTDLADCPCTGRRHPALIATETKVYVGLGDDATGNLDDWWMYTIATDSWSQISDLPGPPRHHPFMFNIKGRVFAGMGHNGPSIYTDWYELDTLSNIWQPKNDFPGEGRVAGTQFSVNDTGYVLSGDGDNHSYMDTGEMWSYNPDTDSWTQMTPHPGRSRWAPGSFVIDNQVYFYGGVDRFANTFPTDVWKYKLGEVIVDTSTNVGIDEKVLANTYVYPNPANDFILWENDDRITQVLIFNIMGELVMRSNADTKRMNVSALKSGIYFVQFNEENTKIKTSKILIQH